MTNRVRPRHVRHRKYERLRHSTYFLRWLNAEADRTGTTPDDIFQQLLDGKTFETIEAEPSVAPPTNVDLPSISGTTTVGETLTCDPGTWDGYPAPDFTYQWKRNGTVIDGATSDTYTLVEDDATAMISCSVTGTNDAGSETVDSDEVGPVAEA